MARIAEYVDIDFRDEIGMLTAKIGRKMTKIVSKPLKAGIGFVWKPKRAEMGVGNYEIREKREKRPGNYEFIE